MYIRGRTSPTGILGDDGDNTENVRVSITLFCHLVLVCLDILLLYRDLLVSVCSPEMRYNTINLRNV